MLGIVKRAVRKARRLLVESGPSAEPEKPPEPPKPEYNFDPESFLVDPSTRAVRLHPSSAARFWPLFGNQTSWMIPKAVAAGERDPVDGLPVPPRDLWAGYGATPEIYVGSGRAHYESMMREMAGVGFRVRAGPARARHGLRRRPDDPLPVPRGR